MGVIVGLSDGVGARVGFDDGFGVGVVVAVVMGVMVGVIEDAVTDFFVGCLFIKFNETLIMIRRAPKNNNAGRANFCLGLETDGSRYFSGRGVKFAEDDIRVRPGGIEPPSSVPKTDTLSVKLRALKKLKYIILKRCLS